MPLNREQRDESRAPLRIVVIYVVIGVLWIVLSDTIVTAVFKDPHMIRHVSIAKGWVYVVSTAWLLYALIKKDLSSLHSSEAHFRATFDYAPAAIFEYDREGIVLHANPACEKITGFTREQIIGRSMFETFAPEATRKLTEEVIARVFSGATVEGIEWEDRRADGSVVYLLTNSTPVFDEKGDVTMGISLNIDVTERKLAEKRRSELEDQKRDFYRRTIMAATEGKLVVTEHAEIERIAGPALKTWNIRSGEDLGKIRNAAAQIAEGEGMDEDRLFDFILGIGEATTNAFKHAGTGNASMHKIPDGLMCLVSDKGRGIEALVLPELALVKGYTTAESLGMGYKAMISIADRIYLATGPDGTLVGIAMGLHPKTNSRIPSHLPDPWKR
ncbi:MAG TPA: PAS domain S-box protein [Armatimonadota bacterium]|jgi:PAS domain S-box-containing protein